MKTIMNKECVICGFNRGTEDHHIIKAREGGSDDAENKARLCKNHHWLADFGTVKERKIVLNMIKEITGKSGKFLPGEELSLLDKKIFALEEEVFGEMDKPFKKQFRNSSNYISLRSWLLGRGCPKDKSYLLNKKSEILLLIKKLKEEIPKI